MVVRMINLMSQFAQTLISNNQINTQILLKKNVFVILLCLNGFIHQAFAPKPEESLQSTKSDLLAINTTHTNTTQSDRNQSYNLKQLETVSELIISSMPVHPARARLAKLIKKNKKAIQLELQKAAKSDIDDNQLHFFLEELYQYWSKVTGRSTADLQARNEKLLTIRACQSLLTNNML